MYLKNNQFFFLTAVIFKLEILERKQVCKSNQLVNVQQKNDKIYSLIGLVRYKVMDRIEKKI